MSESVADDGAEVSPASRRKPIKRKPKIRRAGLIGPLFYWDLVRLARRGQDARARFILAIMLFFVLTAFALVWFRKTAGPAELFFGESQQQSVNESSAFGVAFTGTFLIAQLGILCLLTPAYAAGGIADEKERRTFHFLLASELTAREIVFGKFLGRTVFLLGVMLAGLPVLALCQLHGGASPEVVLMSYLVTGCTVILLSAVGAVCAASAATYRGALFRAYGLTAIITLTGYGIFPLLSPLAVIPMMFSNMSSGGFWLYFWGIGYPIGELVLAFICVLLAINSVRKLRSRMTPLVLRPPRVVLERYLREDRDRARHERELRGWEDAVAAAKIRRDAFRTPAVVPEELVLEPDPHANDAGPVHLRAKAILQAPASAVQPAIPPRPVHRIRVQPRQSANSNGEESSYSARPRIGASDPFFWKERYTSGTIRTEDDEAMRGMMWLVGGIIALLVLLFGLVGFLYFLKRSSSEETRGMMWLVLATGGGSVFVHLLQIGLSACGAVCKERQRLTLESLLTIPVPRRDILWPKWRVSLVRGWWWGGPSAAILAGAFLASPAPLLFVPAIFYFIAAALFSNSFGIWLSIRCRSVSKALMWYLPVIAMLIALPTAVCVELDQASWMIGFATMTAGLIGLGCGSWLFWSWAVNAFENESVLGPGRG